MIQLDGWLTVVVILLSFLFVFAMRPFNYWAKRNIPFAKPWPIIGNLAPVLLKSSSYAGFVTRLYRDYPGVPCFGIFNLWTPSLVVKHPDLVQAVVKGNFESFPDRGISCDSENDPLSANLFFLTGDQWKWLRTKLVPVFTAAKLRGMVPLLELSSERTVQRIREFLESGKGCQEAKELFSQYGLQVIARCGFGMDDASYEKLEEEFTNAVRAAFSMKGRRGIEQLVRLFQPKLARRLGIPFVPKELGEFFMGVVKCELEARRKDPERRLSRKDFLQLLMDIGQDQRGTDGEEGLSDEMIAAQAFSFVVASFESMASALSFLFYNLASRQDVQERVRSEANKAIADNPEDMYDAIGDMKYLDAAINESLRIFPPVGGTVRVCRQDTVLSTSDGKYEVKVESGNLIVLPIQALQRDPDHYVDPMIYNPDRFKEPPKPGTFYPFGDGQRICIAKRFAMIEMKVIVSHVLKSFKVSVNRKTVEPLVMDTGTLMTSAKGGIWLDFQPV